VRLRSLIASMWHPHKDPRWIAMAQTVAGRLAIWVLACLLVFAANRALLLPAAAALALYQIFPARRRLILCLASLAALWLHFPRGPAWAAAVASACLLALAFLVFLAARNFRRWPKSIQSRPLIALHALACLSVFAMWRWMPAEGWARAVLILLLASWSFLLWRFSYLVHAGRRGKIAGTGFLDHLLYLWPAWGGTSTPYGKGYEYLSERSAGEGDGIARSQLAGLKLLGLALLWKCVRYLLAAVAREQFPALSQLIGAGAYPLWVVWISLFLELVREVLDKGIYGHVVVGWLRLLGFYVFRNTYKPLLSRSLVDFWNRYYYYFKELLVEFFFFPVYLRWFKKHPRLRLLTATLAAACAGNIYYHVFRDWSLFARYGAVKGLERVAPRALYTLMLALGIFASMLREKQRRGREAAESPIVSLRRIAYVWTFFAVIHIWNVGPSSLTLRQRTAFFLSLFGIHDVL